jgi:hypothetical protein
VKNIYARLSPPAQRCVVLHHDPTNTEEWLDCDAEMVSIEDFDALVWDHKIKNVLIIDEIAVDSLKPMYRAQLERHFNYAASHKNVLTMLIAQSMYSVPPQIRRAANAWVLWKSVDLQVDSDIKRKAGHDFRELSKLCVTKYDSICFYFDETEHKLRFNIFTPIVDKTGPPS